MSELIQLAYASRSNMNPAHSADSVEPGVVRILTQSRRNNKSNHIGGMLCHGDGCFFQCLEGERDAVEALYERLHQDDRHRDVTLLLKRTVKERRFRLWPMKYLAVNRTVRQQIQKAGLDRFDPYRFDEAITDRMISALQEATPIRSVQAGTREAEQVLPAARGGDMLPLVYLGAGALLCSLIAMSVLAFGVL